MRKQEVSTSIRISKELKTRLDLVKKGYTYAGYIEKMLNYFTLTRISPDSIELHHGQDVLKRVESVISILKSIEKTKVDVLLRKVDSVTDLLSGIPETGSNENISLDELNTVVNRNQYLEGQLNKRNADVVQLQQRLRELEMGKHIVNNERYKELFEFTQSLLTDSNYSLHGTDYRISARSVDLYKERLKDFS